MIKIRISGFPYVKDFFELTRVFFPGYEIINEDQNIQSDKGYLLDIYFKEQEDLSIARTIIYKDNKVEVESIVDLKYYNINMPKDKTIKNAIKKSLYDALVKLTNKEVPWGILTGIRPTKIVHDLYEKNTSSEDVLEILTKYYMLSEEKARLIMDISKTQKAYLYPVDKDKFSLYVGIPFCPSRCIYCSFASYPTGKFSYLMDDYVDKLIYEIKSIKNLTKGKRINTVYIGGGTPTALSLTNLERIIQTINSSFGRENIREFTVEAGRPDTITPEILQMLKSNKVDRISINPQTMNEKTLRAIGRNHSPQDIINAYKMSKSVGFKSINMDLIVGLPGEGVSDLKNTLKIINDLNPDNLTVHTLAIKRGSIFKDNLNDYSTQEEGIIGEMLDETKDYAVNNCLEPYYLYRQKHILGNYENIGYAKKGQECIYNISIMEERESIIGAGVGSTTKVYYPDEGKLERIFNFKDIKEYITRIDEVIQRKRDLIGKRSK